MKTKIKFQERASRKGYLVPGSKKMFTTKKDMQLNTLETNLIFKSIYG